MISISIVIISKNRFAEAKKCLESILRQEPLPNELLFIEDIENNKFFSQEELVNLFKLVTTKVRYYSVNKKNSSYSRNLGLKNAKSDVILFVDDDVILDSSYIKNLLKLYKNKGTALGFVGKILPQNKNIFGQFSSEFFMQEIQSKDKEQKIITYPSAAFSILRKKIIKKSIYFREDFSYCEDIDFFLNLYKNKCTIYFSPSLLVNHKFRTSISGFLLTYFKYAQYYLLLQKYHKENFNFTYFFPSRKFHLVFFPLFLLNLFRSLMSDFWIKTKKTEMIYIFPLILYALATICGVYSSKEGKNFFKKKLHIIFTQ